MKYYQKNVSLVVNEGKCAGCYACYNICPLKAIEMRLSDEGFYVPNINDTLCSECGLCLNVCPVVNIPSGNRFPSPIAYTAWSLNETTRISSSSGGIYPELARMVLEKKGVVFAVGWSKEWFAEHKEVTDTQKIPETLGSKYVQSKVGDSYEKVIGYISGGKQVLFVGTPCQIAGLRNVIKQERITENDVILVDLVCHGVPSLFAFKKYLKEHFETDKIESIQFRNKSKGWTRFQIVIETIDGKKYEAVYYKDSFFYGFLINLYLASICYNCPFSKIPRQGDITLGDFWGVPKEYKDERGVSVVLVNSEKGNEFFSELIEGKRIFAEQVPLEIAAKSNPRIISGRLEIPKEREQILKALNNKSWKYIARKYIKPPVGLRSIIIRRGLSFAKRMIKKIFKE